MLLWLVVSFGCGGSDADALGVGAECANSDECDVESGQACLAFRGGYCGIEGCVDDLDCPDDSACVAHDDGKNYCFRTCIDKGECNANRSVENEANCSSSVDFTDTGTAGSHKACVPPSGL